MASFCFASARKDSLNKAQLAFPGRSRVCLLFLVEGGSNEIIQGLEAELPTFMAVFSPPSRQAVR